MRAVDPHLTNWPNMTIEWLKEVASDDFNTQGVEVVRLTPHPVPAAADQGREVQPAAVQEDEWGVSV